VLPSVHRTRSPIVQSTHDSPHSLFSTDDTSENGKLELRAQLPNEFLDRVMIRYSQIANGKRGKKINPCDYHAHQTKDDRKNCKESNILAYDSDCSSDSNESDSEQEEEGENDSAGAQ